MNNVTSGRDNKRRKRPRSDRNAEIHKRAIQNATLQHELRESERSNRKLMAEINRLRAERCMAIFGGCYFLPQWIQ